MTQDTFRTISITDPAIDHTNSNIEQFKQTRDLSLINFLPGETPTYFNLRKLPLSLKLWIKNRESVGDAYKYLDSFCAGVDSIDGSGTILNGQLTATGAMTLSPTKKLKLGKTELYIWDIDELDPILGERFDVLMEIGSVVWGLLFLKGSTSSKFPFLAM